MIKKKKIFILLLFVSGVLCAQNAPPAAAPILEKTAQKYNALASFSLNFTVNVEEGGKEIESFKGVLLVKKDKYFLTFDDQIIANDGKMMWVYQESANEVALFEAEDDDFSMFHPTKMLNNWEKEYTAKFIREEELQKKQVFVIDLTPKKKMPFYKIRLFITKETSHIQQIMMYEPDGATITYTITKFTPNAAVSEGKFSFNKENFPEVEVVDMR